MMFGSTMWLVSTHKGRQLHITIYRLSLQEIIDVMYLLANI